MRQKRSRERNEFLNSESLFLTYINTYILHFFEIKTLYLMGRGGGVPKDAKLRLESDTKLKAIPCF